MRPICLKAASLDTVLRESAVIFVVASVTADNGGFLGAAEFAKMRRGASFVLLSRAGVVDFEALMDAVRSGHIKAASDVYPQAPKPPNLPAGTFWRDPVHRSIEGAHWLPNVGYGALSPTLEEYFRTRLERLTAGNRDSPLVFFCLKDCWMSWNAAKRALELGYRNVMWFRDGTDGWQELGYPLVDVAKVS